MTGWPLIDSLTISLCVPTYNRAGQLVRALERLTCAVAAHPQRARFEICVSDNASADETPEIIARIAADSGSSLRHIRQERNLGFAGNFAALLRLASGDGVAVFADDDELDSSALDALLDAAQRLSVNRPLVLFNSLPGGDAVFRGKRLPVREAAISGPHDLLRQLGIFHASFVSNLMFHRPSALAHWQAGFEQSRYPHTILALVLLGSRPATFMPLRLVRAMLPPDTGDQPLLTCIDMARVQTEYALGDTRCRGLARGVYAFLIKMLPTAMLQWRCGRCCGDVKNPHASLLLHNVIRCYRRSKVVQLMAMGMWLFARILPLPLLAAMLRRVSRHPR